MRGLNAPPRKILAPDSFTIVAMDRICSLLSTEHGPQMRTTSSCSPRRTSPIGTEEAPRESRAASLYGFSTGTIASTPRIAAMAFSRRSASGPMTPMITRDAPRLICASSPNSRTRVMIRWICSSVALGCVITIILLVRDHQNEVSRNFLQAQIQRRTKPDVSINIASHTPSRRLL